jgi:hypothetical protein
VPPRTRTQLLSALARLSAWLLLIAALSPAAFADAAATSGPSLELYVPFETYHMPYAYSSALRRTYNDFPAGGGLGLGRYSANGTWRGAFALQFSDSHRKPQYNGGLAWIPTWHPFSDKLRLGAGLTALIIARSDIRRYTPFPVVLPLGSIGLWNVDVQSTFIPGFKGDGNVLFSWVKLSFY